MKGFFILSFWSILGNAEEQPPRFDFFNDLKRGGCFFIKESWKHTQWMFHDDKRTFELHHVRPLSSSPLRVRPYLMPCSPPHFSSSTPSSRVPPLIEWYPHELICDEGTSRMCQMSRQRRPFWISAIAWTCLGTGLTESTKYYAWDLGIPEITV